MNNVIEVKFVWKLNMCFLGHKTKLRSVGQLIDTTALLEGCRWMTLGETRVVCNMFKGFHRASRVIGEKHVQRQQRGRRRHIFKEVSVPASSIVHKHSPVHFYSFTLSIPVYVYHCIFQQLVLSMIVLNRFRLNWFWCGQYRTRPDWE